MRIPLPFGMSSLFIQFRMLDVIIIFFPLVTAPITKPEPCRGEENVAIDFSF